MRSDGADTLTKLINNLERRDNTYSMLMSISKKKPKNPIIFIFDNELNNDKKPLAKFIKSIKLSSEEIEEFKIKII